MTTNLLENQRSEWRLVNVFVARNRARWLPADQGPWFVREDDPAESLDAVLAERDRVRELHQQWERDGDPDIRDIVGGDPW